MCGSFWNGVVSESFMCFTVMDSKCMLVYGNVFRRHVYRVVVCMLLKPAEWEERPALPPGVDDARKRCTARSSRKAAASAICCSRSSIKAAELAIRGIISSKKATESAIRGIISSKRRLNQQSEAGFKQNISRI